MSEKEAVAPVHHRKNQFFGLTGDNLIRAITMTATISYTLFGYDQGLMSGIITSDQFNTDFPQTKSTGSTDVHHGTVQGTVVSIYEVGCFFGALATFIWAEHLGRRRTVQIGCVLMVLGTIIQITAIRGAHNFLQFMIGRTITGIGNGANTSTIPVWVAETTKSHNRGYLVCMEAAMVAGGTVIAYWVDFGLSYVPSSVAWRVPIALQIVFAVALFAGISVLPESPRWLLTHGYEDEAGEIIAALNDAHLEDEGTQRDIRIILDGIRAAQQASAGVTNKDLFHGGKKQHFRRILIGASSQIFQQLGGCNAVIYYATVLFEDTIGLETRLSLILGGVLSIVYALSAFTAFLAVERFGRRTMFLAGTWGQLTAMVIIFACLIPGTPGPAKGAAFGLFFYIMWFGSTWLPLPWLYPAELNPLRVRTKANSISTMCNWIFNFLVVQVLPTMTTSIGWATFLIFAIANAIFIPIIYFFYPETAGRTLEEIDIIFAKAHVEGKKPTHVANDMEKLTQTQVERVTNALDIHNVRGDDLEKGGNPAGKLASGDSTPSETSTPNATGS
ncbi:general substrate transporter [Stereum hirsutum FP-91666 SS1]|uniref:general substrate transporter n=1 Tax=Stereum hirsutum (strain FP-91666) TaxID=721885 RepID=UPI000440DEA8|nr:general substrate transporter [Stereum hirsutum FP-91666 SS1]EIM87185.1 general substrate transporter [Stereum hirsutum FP-91666 SS1]